MNSSKIEVIDIGPAELSWEALRTAKAPARKGWAQNFWHDIAPSGHLRRVAGRHALAGYPDLRADEIGSETHLLRAMIDHLRAQTVILARKLAAVEKREASTVPATTTIDPRLAWCRDHLSELRAHPGCYAAIVVPNGMVAVSKSLSEVRERFAALGIDRRSVLIVQTDDFSA